MSLIVRFHDVYDGDYLLVGILHELDHLLLVLIQNGRHHILFIVFVAVGIMTLQLLVVLVQLILLDLEHDPHQHQYYLVLLSNQLLHFLALCILQENSVLLHLIILLAELLHDLLPRVCSNGCSVHEILDASYLYRVEVHGIRVVLLGLLQQVYVLSTVHLQHIIVLQLWEEVTPLPLGLLVKIAGEPVVEDSLEEV